MQVNAINSMNFKGAGAYAEYPQSMPTIAPDTLAVLDKLADKAKSDVHPSTVIATVLAVTTAALSVRKLVPYVRRLAVTLGEEASKFITKTTGEIINKFKKENPIDIQKAVNSIKDYADKLRKGNPDSKLIQNATEFVSKISGKTTDELADFGKGLEKAGIKNGVDAFDTAIALGAGALTLDPVSDKVEEHNDTRDILEGMAEFLG